ncbi:MAG: PEP-CTERM sorting domain-containing protein [Planctomycetota bacterium]
MHTVVHSIRSAVLGVVVVLALLAGLAGASVVPPDPIGVLGGVGGAGGVVYEASEVFETRNQVDFAFWLPNNSANTLGKFYRWLDGVTPTLTIDTDDWRTATRALLQGRIVSDLPSDPQSVWDIEFLFEDGVGLAEWTSDPENVVKRGESIHGVSQDKIDGWRFFAFGRSVMTHVSGPGGADSPILVTSKSVPGMEFAFQLGVGASQWNRDALGASGWFVNADPNGPGWLYPEGHADVNILLVAVIPEPGMLGLFAVGCGALIARRR